MYNFYGTQKGCSRLDIGAVNGAMGIISRENNVKPMYLSGAVEAFTTLTYQPVFTFKQYKVAFLFINSGRMIRKTITEYPPTPNVNQITMTDVTGSDTIGYVVDTNITGTFIKGEDLESPYIVTGSWRYLELTIDTNDYYYYLERFMYDGGDGENGEFSFGGVDGKVSVWCIPITDNGSSSFLPSSYNNVLPQGLVQEAYLKTHHRVIGYSISTPLFTWDASNGFLSLKFLDWNLMSTKGELFQLGFLTEGKATDSYFKTGTLRNGLELIMANRSLHSDGFQFFLLTFRTTGRFNGSISTRDILRAGYQLDLFIGIFFSFGTFGAIEYTGIQDRELSGIIPNNTGTTVDFVDNYAVGSIVQHASLPFYEDFANVSLNSTGHVDVFEIGSTNLDVSITPIAGIESTDNDMISIPNRGCFIVS